MSQQPDNCSHEGGSPPPVPRVFPGGITCERCVDFLLDYVDGAIDDDRRRDFEAHLAGCPDCTAYLDNYRKAAAITANLGRRNATDRIGPMPQSLIDAILKARRPRG